MRAITSKIQKINGPWARHEVSRNSENQNSDERKHRNEIIASIFPKLLPELFPTETSDLSTKNQNQNGYGGQVNGMVDKVMVAQLNILEIHRLEEVRQPSPYPDGECERAGVGA